MKNVIIANQDDFDSIYSEEMSPRTPPSRCSCPCGGSSCSCARCFRIDVSSSDVENDVLASF